MKKTAIILAALAAGAGLNAQDVKSSYSVTTDFTYASEYIFRGVELAGNSFQPSVEVTVEDFYLGLWTNQPVTKREANEVDVYAGYKFKVNEQLSWEAVGTYYWYPEAKGWETRESYEAGIGATYTVSGISTSVYGYYDFVLEATTGQASVGYSFPLEAAGTSLDFSVFFGSVDAKDWAPDSPMSVSESYTYYGADLSIPYKLNDHATATAGVHYAANENTPVGTPDSNLWFTVGLSVGF
jgi:uncharacterized protein (TIGR02001 family)